jgi:predicted O-methyltransferase YrrM
LPPADSHEDVFPNDLDRVPPEQIRRIFDYDRGLLPNSFLAERDAGRDLVSAVRNTGLSIGYPAWNLLYYSLLCSMDSPDPVIVETGTNLGYSSIVLAQALRDRKAGGIVRTVDINPAAVAQARENALRAGVADLISFSVGDSLDFLRGLARELDHIDFVFLDGGHAVSHVIAEFEIVCPLLRARGGKAYFDNSGSGDVAEAINHLRAAFGGNFIHFANSSWCPPGSTLWQP